MAQAQAKRAQKKIAIGTMHKTKGTKKNSYWHKKKKAQKKVAIDTKKNKKHEVCTMGGVGGHTNTGIPLALINSELQGPMQRNPYFILTYHTSYIHM